jgi:hypothetical protein
MADVETFYFKDLTKIFLENVYQNFDRINDELNMQYSNVNKSIENNYENLLYSNSKLNLLKKLKTNELFLMNIHDKHILAILNISIYNAIVKEDYELLYNGIYTYNHLRKLNRMHLTGFKFNEFIESLIFNENKHIEEDNWKEYIINQFFENYGSKMSGKFDMELAKILKKIIAKENDIENNYNNLFKLYSKCQWLSRGWYQECNLINYMPIFLAGIYKFIGQDINIETENKWFTGFIDYLNKNRTKENKLVYNFSGEISFLNKILDKDYNDFYKEYKNKI